MSIVNQLVELKEPFAKQNNFDMVFETECLFAKQQITKNDFTLKTAENNKGSLRNAILNVAAIGISLNPASAHAYLVPRDGMVCLDISYRGLVKLATDAGAIEWAKAVLVYEGDEFKWCGPNKEPIHEADVFDTNRINATDPLQNLKGGYCIAKLKDGFMVDVMTAGEILEVRDSSKAKNGPWKGKWAGEMAKKTLVKRAYKSWPQSGGRERLDEAINVLNEHEGLSLPSDNSGSDYLRHSPEQLEQFKTRLEGDPLDYHLWYQPLDDRIKISLVNSFTEAKGKGRELANNMSNTGRELFTNLLADLTKACENEDDLGAKEILDDLPDNQKAALIDALDLALVRFANSIGEES